MTGSARVPRAVQREREARVMHRRRGTPVPLHDITGVPGLQRIIPLRFMLRCARDTRPH